MARSGDSSDTIESVQLGESDGYDGSGEYYGSVGPGDPCDTYESDDEHGTDEQDSR